VNKEQLKDLLNKMILKINYLKMDQCILHLMFIKIFYGISLEYIIRHQKIF